MRSTLPNPIFFLKQSPSVHWVLFGLNSLAESVYFLEVKGNKSTKTKVLSKQDAGHIWKTLLADGFEKVNLRDAGAIPFHLDQRIREWHQFASKGFYDRIYMDDPWGADIVRGNEAKTLSDIADGFTISRVDDEDASRSFAIRSCSSQIVISEQDASFDDHWNSEMATWEDSLIDREEEDDEEICGQQEESYQRWILEQEKRDDEMANAIEEYCESADGVGHR